MCIEIHIPINHTSDVFGVEFMVKYIFKCMLVNSVLRITTKAFEPHM